MEIGDLPIIDILIMIAEDFVPGKTELKLQQLRKYIEKLSDYATKLYGILEKKQARLIAIVLFPSPPLRADRVIMVPIL